MTWTLRSGLALVRRLEIALAPNYHVALAGSVAMRGRSDKDLDVIVFPHKAYRFDLPEIHTRLRLHMEPLLSREKMTEMWRRRGIDDTKHVEVWTYRDRRVDVIIFGGA